MYQHIVKIFSLIFATGIFLVSTASAQDIIVKTDQTEIKSKVLEIEDNKIKYKLFDHQDGPTYNIPKQEVFMIIYQGGKRETFANTDSPVTTDSTTTVSTQARASKNTTTQTASSIDAPPPVDIGTFLTLATNFDVLGVDIFNVTILSEGTGLIKSAGNFMRTGISCYLAGAEGYSSVALLIHATPHVPINRLTGNYDKQDIGLFPYVRFGIGYSSLSTAAIEDTVYDFAHQVAFGVDYLFTKKFGVTVYSDKFQSFSGGISFKF